MSTWGSARTRGKMPKFMISFGAGAMDHIPDEDMPAVADAAHGVVQEILDAGAYVLSGGLESRTSSIVAPSGTVTDGPPPSAVAGVTIIEVSSRDEALRWAAKIAAACRCAQEVWQIGHDLELEAMIHRAGTGS
jgi:hypothetical protein